jgi:hypothetical protein
MTQVNRLEQQLEDNRQLMKLRDMALKLSENREFRKLILEGFCRDECARYAQLSADPALKAEERADALGMAQAAGHLRRFLSVTVRMGHTAEAQIADLEQAIEEARAEEGEEPVDNFDEADDEQVEG